MHTEHSPEAALVALLANMLESLQDLEAGLDEKFFAKVGLLRLICAIQIKEREIVRFTYHVHAVLHFHVIAAA